jgi:hypothetical protein
MAEKEAESLSATTKKDNFRPGFPAKKKEGCKNTELI